MSAHLHVVVGGAPAMAQALTSTKAFAHVHAVASVEQLRVLVGSGNLPNDKDQLVFLFADNLDSGGAPVPLDALVGKLVNSGRRVIILALSGNAQNIVSAHRRAGLLTGPFTLNATLGAISGLGMGMVAPIDAPGAYEAFDAVGGPVPDVTPAQPAPAPAPQPAPQAPAADAGSWAEAGGWGQPAGDDAGGAWGQPAKQQDPAEAAMGAWGQPAPQQPTEQSGAPAERSSGGAGWESVGSAGDLPDSWKQPPAVTAEPDPAPAAQTPAADAPAGGRSLAAAAGRSLSDAAQGTPAPSAGGAPQDSGGGSWQDSGAWGQGTGLEDPQPAAPAPMPRGGMNVVHNQVRQRRGWVITISSPKGGTGKTSLSTNLAAYLGLQMRAQGKTVCLVDGNYGQADVGKILDTYMPNIMDLARDPSAVHVDRIAQKLVHRPDLNLSALLGPASPKDANPVVITPELYNRTLDVLQELYDYIVIDTQVAERFSSMHTEFSIPRADRLIVPVNPNLATLMNADAWLRSICEPKHSGGIGYDESKVGILLNMAMEGVDCDVDDVMRELGSWTFIGAIPMTPVWQKALNNNDLVATYNYEELNQAFAAVLYAATGEPALIQQSAAATPTQDDGLVGKLKGLLKKGRR